MRARSPRLPVDPDLHDLAAKLLRGLADPTRLRIIAALAAGERSVGELAVLLEQSQPSVSNHLATLRWCRFVATRREHRTVYYRIANDRAVDLARIAGALARGVDDDREAASQAGDRAIVEDGAVAPPAPPAERPDRCLWFLIGERLHATPAIQVREVLPFTKPRRLPGRSPTRIGIINRRGALLEVHDLARFLGVSSRRRGPCSWSAAMPRWSGWRSAACAGSDRSVPAAHHGPPPRCRRDRRRRRRARVAG